MQQPAEKPLLLKKHIMAEEALAEREGKGGGGGGLRYFHTN